MRRSLGLLALLFVGVAHAAPEPFVTLAVPGDRPVFVLPGGDGAAAVVVYLHGHCGDALAPMNGFPEASRGLATLLSVQADVPCADRPGRFHWSPDLAAIERRIDAAIAAAAVARGAPFAGARILVGYSEGALRAEGLAKRFPDVYPRVLLGASPVTPQATSFPRAKAVATLVGELDVQGPMRDGTDALAKAGVPTRLFVLPGVGHGRYGEGAPRVMRSAFEWMLAQ